MEIEVKSYTEKPIKAAELKRLYNEAGWWEKRKEEDIENILESEISVGAWDGDLLIGFARAVSDGKFRAYIEDVVIHTKFQKSGIGTEIVSRLLKELSHIDVISLFCEEELIPFYERNKFKHIKAQCVMHK
ncbi:GNAT family N-acetyltransferase [Halobacillus trueperi]|uniref:N-acetyltransferase n=1 Tax=Halobacillus trueperi TaxID=156205 RepID=A0A3E0J4Y9_9BACI|nr:GNAT family N-acetyltransferase [Halobacillus trueperi]REJ07950.1 N-acetyltransferase [Halobacillus trueperi]